MSLPVSLQLYTLRDETAKDFKGTLEKVANIGYKGVEFAGYGGLTAAQMKAELDRLGLKVTGSHVGMDILRNNLEETIAYNLEIGNKYIVCPGTKGDTKEHYLEVADFFNRVGEKCKEKGLQLGYHNHAHEFKLFDGEYALDILYNNTNAELLKVELDTYWVQYAGVDPIAYMKKYAGRCPLLHQKDMEAGEEKGFTEVGNGIMDIKGIHAAVEEIGVEWFIVEQDRCVRPQLESVAISFNYLKSMGFV